MFLRTISVALVFAVGVSFSLRADNEENNQEKRRWKNRQQKHDNQEGKRNKGQCKNNMHQRWFMQIPAVKDELEKHREKQKSILKNMKEQFKSLRKNRQGEKDAKPDREAIGEETKEIFTKMASSMVDELSRHYHALADLIAKNKETAIQKMQENMKRRHKKNNGQHNKRREQRGKERDGNENGENNEINLEGAVF